MQKHNNFNWIQLNNEEKTGFDKITELETRNPKHMWRQFKLGFNADESLSQMQSDEI